MGGKRLVRAVLSRAGYDDLRQVRHVRPDWLGIGWELSPPVLKLHSRCRAFLSKASYTPIIATGLQLLV